MSSDNEAIKESQAVLEEVKQETPSDEEVSSAHEQAKKDDNR